MQPLARASSLVASLLVTACKLDTNVGVATDPTVDAQGAADASADGAQVDAGSDAAALTGTWRVQDIIGEFAPRDVWGSSASDAWVVGTSGGLLRWNGMMLSLATAPTTLVDLDSVWVANNAVAYAVGERNPGVGPDVRVFKWDGTTWSGVTTPADNWMSGVFGLAGSVVEVWSAGHAFNFIHQSSPAMPWVSKYDQGGPYWNEDVWIGGFGQPVWIVGLQGITRYDAQTAQFTNQSIAGRFWGVFGHDPNDAWAVGEDGMIAHWNGTSWTAVPSGVTTDLRAVWASGPSNAWAVGDDATIVHWNGSAWTPLVHGLATTDDLRGIWGSSATDILAVGGETSSGIVLRFSP